jgi:hypothetical protein
VQFGDGALAGVSQTTDPSAIGSGDDLNTSVIQQFAQTSAFVQQIGQGNSSGVRQESANSAPDNGFFYAVEVRQLGQDGTSFVRQAGGTGNEASLRQLAGSSMAFSEIDQAGSDNVTKVEQGGIANRSSVIQTGDLNTALVGQMGSNNFSSVTQTGNGNTASVSQGGAVAPTLP